LRSPAQMILDLTNREYVFIRGRGVRGTTRRGKFNDFLGIVLTETTYLMDTEQSGPNVRVTLFGKDLSPLMDFYFGSDPRKAVETTCRWGSRLDIPLIDQAG